MAVLFAAVLIAGTANRVVAAVTNDLRADWSDAQNPNGVWSYNQGTTPLPRVDCVLSNCPKDFSCCIPAWEVGACGASWFQVPPCDITNVSYYHIQAGDILMYSAGEGNVTWTAASDGFVSISGGVWAAASLGRGNHWELYHNQNSLTRGDISDSDPQYSRTMPFDFRTGSGGPEVLQNRYVGTGDIIKLKITKTSSFGTLAGVNLAVISSPEPIGVGGLRIQLNPGLVVYGNVGKTYRIDYVAQAGNTNWMSLTNVVLPSSPYLVIDPQPVTLPARFYRAVEIP